MKKFIRLTVVFLIIVILYAWGFTMKTEFYSVNSEKNNSLRIVFISDLHNCTYGGKDQSVIIKEIEENKPDLVLFGGDVIDTQGDTENALTLMKTTAEKYPCAYSAGNHEEWRDDLNEFYKDVKNIGIPVLDGNSTDFMINNQKIRVYGIIDAYEKISDIKTDDDYYNILLLHQPEQFPQFTENFDLILSGHAHGGQWRLPVILEQGLYAPNQGLFPDYTNGKYEYGKCTHIISRGLARPLRMIFIPRIFNRPEISVIDIYQ
ncbi:MAG: metallophosphoesterase [Ruminococcus sp.]|nr:metallophosphoesterase [Ruminococcus sp.]